MIDFLRDLLHAAQRRAEPLWHKAPAEAVRLIDASITKAPWSIGSWLLFFRLARPLTKRIEAQARVLAKSGDLPGWHVAIIRRTVLDPAATYQLVKDHHGPTIAEIACPRKAGLGRLLAAARKAVPKGEGILERDRLLCALMQSGGCRDVPSERLICEVDPHLGDSFEDEAD